RPLFRSAHRPDRPAEAILGGQRLTSIAATTYGAYPHTDGAVSHSTPTGCPFSPHCCGKTTVESVWKTTGVEKSPSSPHLSTLFSTHSSAATPCPGMKLRRSSTFPQSLLLRL